MLDPKSIYLLVLSFLSLLNVSYWTYYVVKYRDGNHHARDTACAVASGGMFFFILAMCHAYLTQ